MYYFSSTYRTLRAVTLTLSFVVGGIGNLQLSRFAPRDLNLLFTLQTILLGGCVGVIGMGYGQAMQMQSTWIAGFIVIALSQYVILITHRLISF
ncbi:hypothetical protein AALP_AA2G129700 [Arabis alpina]|uniref:Uncharacterized protein n=1 Tax=Arabis alpina TaxID=50452 RepID=A0A087HH27_ARAAL|nr:hypothetical protein AALP_AA2G129700 [Arabis alpina]